MLFLNTFLSADVMSVANTPTGVGAIDNIEILNAQYAELYATNDVETEPTEIIPKEWDFNTILHGDYSTGELTAGNVNWTLDNITNLIIKRKKVSDYKWTTVFVKDISTIEDLNIIGTDVTPTSGDYSYAAVPVLNMVEGNYSTTDVKVEVKNLVIIDQNGIYTTGFSDGLITETCNIPNSVQVTMYNQYPTVISNSDAHYKTLEIKAQFFPLNGDEGCDADAMEDDAKRIAYTREVESWLCNKKTKLVKNLDSRTWLIWVTTPPTVSADTVYQNLEFSFGCTEVGNPNNEEDLYYAGILDPSVTEEWWNS